MRFKQELLNTFNGEQVKDEYEIQHSRHVQAGNFVWFFWGLIILLNISIWIKIFLQQVFVIEVLGLLLFIGLSLWIELNLKKYRANRTEVDDAQSYEQMISQLRRSAVLFGAAMFATSIVVNVALRFALEAEPPSMGRIIFIFSVWVICAVLSGVAIYILGKKKIDRTYKDK
ncbi:MULTISPECIES: hypothetical protein [unclassified Staphylococcus]|uniref:hypothetical protein n=1 Tax=unclassified Staphylococcus TaxID=91994 RepID=UPI0021CE951C|nr:MULTISPECIES: hypothetical protein [unclassified Staphylococcus]UXR69343.1 hypothetical protein MUA26_09495 [Staphylococcus sp. IVB6246]UXR71398.1 hypothetical protein MUA88_09515 [Staphylococcus sp. IVB6240]UXR73677.1 hypothetical protein MUA48_10020 [Staphylococcus sp. IVB6238]UXR75994.1 hypothetical protein MUA74_10105 [Staphylococcus sp. IVB6233]UXR80191.1 hypothetical protein MUA65_09710 [Staphylococcus sp. IVB6218]